MKTKNPRMTTAQKRAKKLALTGAARSGAAALLAAEEMLAQEAKARADIRARDLRNDQALWHGIIDYVLEHWPNDPADGLEAADRQRWLPAET